MAGERLEVRFERAPQAGAVLGLEALEPVHVGEQRLASRPELDHLGLEATALGVHLAPRGRLGLGELRPGLALGVVEDLAGLELGLGHGFVGGPLGEQQRAVQHVLGLAGLALLALDRADLLGEPADALVQALDRRGGPFEQLVHVVTVVPAKAFADVDVTELAGRYVHAVMLGRATRAR